MVRLRDCSCHIHRSPKCNIRDCMEKYGRNINSLCGNYEMT